MVSPERSKSDNSVISTQADLTTALTDVDRQLELADEIENPIERFFRREKLLEQRDELQAEIEEAISLPKLP